MKNLNLLNTLLVVLLLSSCIVTDEEFGSSKTSERTVKVRMNEITAFLSCEGNGTTGEGDLYSTLTIFRNSPTSNTPILLAESPQVLHQLSQGEILSTTDLFVEAQIEPFDGMIVSILFETFEKDPNSVQIEYAHGSSYTYNEQQECWMANGGGTSCDEIVNNEIQSRMDEGTCDILFKWSQTIE